MGSTSAGRLRVGIALWTVYLVWGSTYLAIRYSVRTIPPFVAAGVRYVAAGLVLGLIIAAVKGVAELRVTRAQLINCAVVGLLLCMGGNGMVMIAEQTVPSGLAALIIACVPLFVVILRRVGGEVPTRATVMGVLIGIVGVGVLLLPGTTPHGVKGIHLALNVLAPMLWSIGSYFSTKRELPRNPLVASTYEMLAGGVTMVVVAAAKGDFTHFSFHQVSSSSAWAWLYLVGPGSIIAMSAYVWLLANAPISMVATYSFVNPVVAVALGSLISNEKITAGTLVGGAIIITAVAVVIRAQSRESAPPGASHAAEPIAPPAASAQPA